jgi:hypothetical protein
VVKVSAGESKLMNVTCRKCGALVPGDHAFCTECGAVLAEETRKSAPADDSPEFAATISGQYPLPTTEVPAPKPKEAEMRDSAPQVRSQAVTTPVKARSRSGIYFILGLVAVLLLGGLLFYLFGIILSR